MAKIVHINCAVSGSTGKIIADIARFAAPLGYETLSLTPMAGVDTDFLRYKKVCLPKEQGIYRRLCRFTGYQFGMAHLPTRRILKHLRREKPDLVHIHCINGFMVNVYKLFDFLKKQGIPTVITNHAEFFYTGSCDYSYDCDKWMTGCGECPRGYSATFSKKDTTAKAWQKMQKAFSGFTKAVMVSVSPWVGSRASVSPITRELDNRVVLNGVNLQVFHLRAEAREKLGLPGDRKIVFHPTAHFSDSPNDRKGGKFLLDLAKKLPEVRFYVAGQYAQGMQVPENMTLLGRLSDQNLLADYYAAADLTVITSRKETFNMPVAESLCCGTPVVGFFAGGPESIAIPEYARFCEFGDVDALEQNVSAMLNATWDKHEIAQKGEGKYGLGCMAQGYVDIYTEVLKKEVPGCVTEKTDCK